MDSQYVIGQILGIVAVVLGFASYQMKTPKGILLFQIATATAFSVHYFLIGALSASVLNLISAIKNVFYYYRNKKENKGVMAPIFFTVLVLITGIATWTGWYSIFIVVGLMINAICLAFSDAQKIRYFTMIKSPLCLIYNIIVLSGGGIFYECASIVSATLGIIRNRHSKMQKETGVKNNGNI